MTWNEFKGMVEAEIEANGCDGDVEIFFFDTGTYPDNKTLSIEVDNIENEITVG